jgi:hypothetical protein
VLAQQFLLPIPIAFMVFKPSWQKAVLMCLCLATAGCDPAPPVQHSVQTAAPACPGLYVKLLPEVEAVVRRYKRGLRPGVRQTLYYVDVDFRRNDEVQFTLYSSLDLTSVFAYQPDSYSTVGPDYVALCSGVAALGDPIPRAQAICDVLSHAWFGKRLARAEIEANVGTRNYNPPMWRVILKQGRATVVDSAASFYSSHGARIQMQFMPPPPSK